MTFLLIKLIHVTSVALSGTLFFVRGLWMLHDSPRLRRRWVRVVPHVVDTVLLASALALSVLSRRYPFVEPWLTAKVLGLFAYIGLGLVALRLGPRLRVRAVAWVGALGVFAYIVAVALTRDPWPLSVV